MGFLSGVAKLVYGMLKPEYQQRVQDFSWLLDWPWYLWLIVLLILLLMTTLQGAYREISQRDNAIAEGQNKLDHISKSLPNIKFKEFRTSPLWAGETETKKIYHIFQLWFCNEPDSPSDQSIAHKVTARISYFRSDERARLFSVYGQWTKDVHPDFIRYKGIEPTKDILPNELRAKLNVALKWPDETDAYGYAAESFETHPDGRHPERAIPPGEYRCCVSLKGVNVNVDHWFKVKNPGAGDLDFEFIRSDSHISH